MSAIAEPDAGGGAADLLHRHDMFDITHPGTAKLLLDGDTQEAELAHSRPEISGEAVAAVYFCRARRDFRGGKLRHLLAQHVDRFAQTEIETAHDMASSIGRGRASTS